VQLILSMSESPLGLGTGAAGFVSPTARGMDGGGGAIGASAIGVFRCVRRMRGQWDDDDDITSER
jgi:hypothetical protein